jgi:hypothetical protein
MGVPALRLLLLFLVSTSVGGCEFIGNVFQAGVWVGVIVVVAIVALIGFIVSRGRAR